ncbi:hypothetical protein CDD80_6592 [Ophiocordyceps camponoti-rufipedis]|uniref:GTP cyclohydrolase N-terminal domain-containing protein n=1 Tax=Ophiocordyceps camponoti-rufipedis TaxID=2004952 RepID=A0A2C5ZHE2_9HYPO|nr:hypothetical protein CDD80_6592 [Ophiocordyceps camponoti-rufipedis]
MHPAPRKTPARGHPFSSHTTNNATVFIMDQSMSSPEVLCTLRELQKGQSQLWAVVQSIADKLGSDTVTSNSQAASLENSLSSEAPGKDSTEIPSMIGSNPTTYPKQIGIDPIGIDWGNTDPEKRGPVVVSRSPSTIRRRNAIGGWFRYGILTGVPDANKRVQRSHGGSYSIYYALAVASKELNVDHRPDFTNTEPAVELGPFPQWGGREKIVAMDPWGHKVPWTFKTIMERENIDLRPTIAITRAHMKLAELEDSVKNGRLYDAILASKRFNLADITKVEPVWYLPGVAERFGIGGLTVYCFGDPAKMSDESARLTLRIHDECNGSDVFGSDICTCRPYLIFGIEEAVKEAQNGGSGVVIYFRKEGRALGEVTKDKVVYNARKRGADRASDYFTRTENIAGIKDMRFQALMPDILHWLGIKKIDRMLSMSKYGFRQLLWDSTDIATASMKYDAIVKQGIPIHERVELPEDLMPADSRVEIDAKITAGYFTAGKRLTAEELNLWSLTLSSIHH